MVIFLTLAEGSGHVGNFLRRNGQHFSRDLAERTYSDFIAQEQVPRAAYVFCDLQRMEPCQRHIAGLLWDELLQFGLPLLNHPQRQMGRFDLLRTLYERGVNDFNAYRWPDLDRETRYPVFVRIESDHGGKRSELLQSREEVDRAAQRLVASGVRPAEVLVTEFKKIQAPDGTFHKYGAFRIGDRIFAQHAFRSKTWECKMESAIRDESGVRATDTYFQENPHGELLRPFFELAQIDYGRIDYSMAGDRPQVWEINDNPMFASGKLRRLSQLPKHLTYIAACREVAAQVQAGPPIGFAESLWRKL